MERVSGWKADLGRRKNALHATVLYGHEDVILGISIRIRNPNILPQMSDELYEALRAHIEVNASKGYPTVRSDIDALIKGQLDIGLNTTNIQKVFKLLDTIKRWFEEPCTL
jgi:hypothetical protein